MCLEGIGSGSKILRLDVVNDVCFPGSQLRGVATVNLNKNKGKKLWKLSLRWHAHEFCYFKNTLMISNNELRQAHDQNDINILDLETVVWERPNSERRRQAPGFAGSPHSWRFVAPVPEHCPSSFDHRNGYIRYTLTLRADFMPDSAVQESVEVDVLTPTSVLRMHCPRAFSATARGKAVNLIGMSKGDVECSIKVVDGPALRHESLVYSAGDELTVQVAIVNHSKVDVVESRAGLLQITRLRCVPAERQFNEPIRTRQEILALTTPQNAWLSKEKGKITKGGALRDTVKFVIPDQCMTVTGKLCSIEYCVELYVKPSNSKAFTARLPIYLGVAGSYIKSNEKSLQTGMRSVMDTDVISRWQDLQSRRQESAYNPISLYTFEDAGMLDSMV